MAADIDDDEIKRQIIAKLQTKYPDVGADQVRALVEEEFSAIADRPVRDFLGVLTERAVKKRIKGAA